VRFLPRGREGRGLIRRSSSVADGISAKPLPAIARITAASVQREGIENPLFRTPLVSPQATARQACQLAGTQL
jgi:hypothetical protein